MKVQSISSAYNYQNKNVNFGLKNPLSGKFVKKGAEAAEKAVEDTVKKGKVKLPAFIKKAAKKISNLNLKTKLIHLGEKISAGAKTVAAKVTKFISTTLDKVESKFHPEKFHPEKAMNDDTFLNMFNVNM